VKKTALAPHCWGQVICFSATAKDCKNCDSGKSCAIQVRESLGELAERIDVSSLIRTNQAFLDKAGVPRSVIKQELKGPLPGIVGKVSERFEVEADFSGLSHHARRIATAIHRAGIDMANDAKHGLNQFRAMKFRPEYMASVQDLMTAQRAFSRDDLKIAILEEKEMTAPALNNTCSFVISAMLALDAIVTVGDGIYAPK
jgi:hypothetical protein